MSAIRMEVSNYHTHIQKGVHDRTGNSRPVSLTSIVCKLTESVIRDSVTSHCNESL